MTFNPLGWPGKKIKAKNPKVLFKKEIYYFPKFFRRNINIILNTKNFRIEEKWYLDKHLEKVTSKTFLTFNFIKYTFSTNFFRALLYLKNIKEISFSKKFEIALFGPFSWNYAHQIHEFLIRLIFLKNTNYKIIYLPEYLKKVIFSKTYKKVFKNKIFRFFSTDNIIKFKNVSCFFHFYRFLKFCILNSNF